MVLTAKDKEKIELLEGVVSDLKNETFKGLIFYSVDGNGTVRAVDGVLEDLENIIEAVFRVIENESNRENRAIIVKKVTAKFNERISQYINLYDGDYIT